MIDIIKTDISILYPPSQPQFQNDALKSLINIYCWTGRCRLYNTCLLKGFPVLADETSSASIQCKQMKIICWSWIKVEYWNFLWAWTERIVMSHSLYGKRPQRDRIECVCSNRKCLTLIFTNTMLLKNNHNTLKKFCI